MNSQPLFALWFGTVPVTRSPYVRSGLALMALKYAVEATAVWLAFGVFFDPWMFVVPSLEGRRVLAGEWAPLLGASWFAWTLPFVWIAVSMTVRRAMDAGWSPFWGLAILVPVVCLLAMLAFAVAPSARRTDPPPDTDFDPEEEPPRAPTQAQARGHLLTGVLLAVAVAAAMLGCAVYVAGDYGLPLMVGTPIVMGMILAVVRHDPTDGSTSLLWSSVLALLACGGLLLVFGLEGVFCIVMVAPLALPLAFAGALIGRGILRAAHRPRRQIGVAVLLLPIWLSVDAASGAVAPVHAVCTSIDIDAPIETVWRTVIAFPELPEPEEWVFRAGIACPIGATIEGRGVGAVRRCEFTTGTFVEPITAWEEPTRLAFDVTQQPAPMFELSPYHDLHPPHLDGTLRSLRGEFRLERLPGARTRLHGTTWYQVEMFPQAYWVLWSDWLIGAIHRRVLRHVARVAKERR